MTQNALTVQRVANGYIVHEPWGHNQVTRVENYHVFNSFADAAKHIEETLGPVDADPRRRK